MKDRLKKIAVPVKNFVYNNRVPLTFGVTLGVCTWSMMRATEEMNEFVAEYDLIDEFHEFINK